MTCVAKNLLLTGPPGCGKTTVIRRVIERLGDLRLSGFYTQEIRSDGKRLGFEAIGLSGQRCTLAHMEVHGASRVGRYGVNLCDFEELLESELAQPAAVEVIVIDEIGKMECLSRRFVQLAKQSLNSRRPVLATVAMRGHGLIEQTKSRADALLLNVRHDNRDQLPDEVAAQIRYLVSTGAKPARTSDTKSP